MLRRILLTALIAGAGAGLVLSAIQWLEVVPLIHQAETYETAAAAGSEAGWLPDPGAQRGGLTVVANLIAAVGFALLLAAGFALRGGVDAGRGLLWGLAGFAAFSLAPSLGLPPELPGAAAAALAERQAWWLLTAVLTALGLALAAFAPRAALKALGLVVIAIPHVIGAPAPERPGGLAPDELADAFVVAVIVSSAIFWLVLGGLSGYLFKKLA